MPGPISGGGFPKPPPKGNKSENQESIDIPDIDVNGEEVISPEDNEE